jgi:ketosteroid isomerase-like protein
MPHLFSLISRTCIPLVVALVISYSVTDAGAATSEERARFVVARLDAAGLAKDAPAVARLLSDDCVIVMTDPAQGSKATRFFTKKSYLRRLRERYSRTGETDSKRVIQSVTVPGNGDVFVSTEVDDKTRVGVRTERIQSREYIVLRESGGEMKIRLILAELVSYVPNIRQ